MLLIDVLHGIAMTPWTSKAKALEHQRKEVCEDPLSCCVTTSGRGGDWSQKLTLLAHCPAWSEILEESGLSSTEEDGFREFASRVNSSSAVGIARSHPPMGEQW